MNNLKVYGKISDLKSMGLNTVYGKFGKNITTIQSRTPFVVSTTEENNPDSGTHSQFSVLNTVSGEWEMSLKEVLNPEDDRKFSVVSFGNVHGKSRESGILDYSLSKGNTKIGILETYLQSFINESDDFSGSVVGVDTKGRKVIDLAYSFEGYLQEDLISTKSLREVATRFKLSGIALYYQSAYEDNKAIWIYLDADSLKAYYNEK